MPQTIKVTVHKKPTLKLKVMPRFPSSVTVTSPILLSQVGGNYAFSFDVNALEGTLSSVYQPLDIGLSSIAAMTTAGIVTETAPDTFVSRSLSAPAAGITITNPAGTAGNPIFALANDLAAVEGLSSTGIARRTGTDAWSVGTAVSNAELSTMAAWTFKANNTSGSATPTDITIDGLTLKASPATGDEVILWDVAGAAIKKATVLSIGSAGAVSSIAGNTGAFTLSTGITNSTNDIRINTSGLTVKTAPDQYADMTPIYDVAGAAMKQARVRPPRGHIWGLTLSNDGTSPNTVLDITAGESASDNATSPLMMVAAAFTKTTGAWAVGSTNGAMDTGTIGAATWNHVFQIMRSDTGVVDYLFSLSATAPTMPTNYDHKRRIGSFKTATSNIVAFKQYEDTFYWAAAAVDSATQPGLTDTLFTLSVPTGIRVKPMSIFSHGISTSAESGIRPRVPDLQTTITGVLSTTADAIGLTTNVARGAFPMNMDLWTNTSAQINIIASVAQTIWVIKTYGWCDTRGRLS